MSDTVRHISSAVVIAFPHRCAEIALWLSALPDTEVHYVQDSKIVIVLEGATTGEVGARLASIGLMDGVLAANLVFEQIDILDDPGVAP